jgi:four helix bundle protein
MMIKSYRELNVWQKADQLALEIYQLSDGFPKKYLYDLTNQLRRAALSVPTNLAEGCASPHSGELLQFINISRRSLSETRYLIEFASKLGLVGPEKSKELERLCTEIGKMLAALTRSIKRQKE